MMKNICICMLLIMPFLVGFSGCNRPTPEEIKTKASLPQKEIDKSADKQIVLSEQIVEPVEVGPEIKKEALNIKSNNEKVKKVIEEQHQRILWLENALKKLKGLTWFDYLIWGSVTIGIIIAAWKLKVKALYYVAFLPSISILFGLLISFILENIAIILLIASILISVIIIAWLNREKIKEWNIIEDLVNHNEKAKKAMSKEMDEEVYGKDGEQGLMGTQKDITKEAVQKVKGK